jgi:hypothetical protein
VDCAARRDDVRGAAFNFLEVAATNVPIGLHVANDGFDGRATAQFALDDAEDAALLTGDEAAGVDWRCQARDCPRRYRRLDRAAGGPLSGIDDGSERVTVARQRLCMEYEVAARGAAVTGNDRALDAELAELVGRAGFALADAFDLGCVKGIELPSALAPLLRANAGELPFECHLQLRLSCDLTADVAAPAACDAGAIADGTV